MLFVCSRSSLAPSPAAGGEPLCHLAQVHLEPPRHLTPGGPDQIQVRNTGIQEYRNIGILHLYVIVLSITCARIDEIIIFWNDFY